MTIVSIPHQEFAFGQSLSDVPLLCTSPYSERNVTTSLKLRQ